MWLPDEIFQTPNLVAAIIHGHFSIPQHVCFEKMRRHPDTFVIALKIPIAFFFAEEAVFGCGDFMGGNFLSWNGWDSFFSHWATKRKNNKNRLIPFEIVYTCLVNRGFTQSRYPLGSIYPPIWLKEPGFSCDIRYKLALFWPLKLNQPKQTQWFWWSFVKQLVMSYLKMAVSKP